MTVERTIASLWREAVAAEREGPAYLHEVDGDWREVSWAEAALRVEELANGLLALGIARGDVVAILARTTVEWALFDFALARVGAVSAPVYASSSAPDARYVLAHSHAVGVLVEDAEQREKIAGSSVAHLLSFADLDELRTRGRAFAADRPDALRAREETIHEDDLFTLLYTSGTTGPPKACMIRHRNFRAMVEKTKALERPLMRPGDVMLLYLPLAHNYGRLLHLAAPYVGYTIAFLPDPLRVADALPRVRPTLFPSVPRVYEKLHAAATARFAEATGLRRRLIERALEIGSRASRLERAGHPLPRTLAAQRALADRLVFRKVRERLGGRLRVASSGGAPLPLEVAELFHALGILVLEGYGLSEITTAATINREDAYRLGTVGRALPGVELRIADDGEILIRSDTVFAGYLDDPAATAAALDDEGFVHTGDVGVLDEDGFLTLTDRKKDLIVTSGGKNVAPQSLETALAAHAVVSQALVIGDRRPYIAALVTVDATRGGADVEAEVRRAVEAVNDGRSRHEQIRRFRVLPREFTSDDGEVTPTLKLRRNVIVEHFAETIDELYAEPR